MMNNENSRKNYYEEVREKGKEHFTIEKMKEYGFWPENLPMPSEKQPDESDESYYKRKEDEDSLVQLNSMISEKRKAINKLNKEIECLNKSINQVYDYDEAKKNIQKQMIEESKMKRAKRKEEKEALEQEKRKVWNKYKSESVISVGKGYSYALMKTESDIEKLNHFNLPNIVTTEDVLTFFDISINELKYLTYHRDVVENDHYTRFKVEKKKGGYREIAAPKPLMKKCQRLILDEILNKVEIQTDAHGFVQEKSIVTNAKTHVNGPRHVINMDLEDFFGTINYHRVLGMFQSLGYNGYVSTCLAMICTYCKRQPIEVKGKIKWVRTSERILPQGSPASPMITNIVCRKMDNKLNGLAKSKNYYYSRYADDISFSKAQDSIDHGNPRYMIHYTNKIVESEGFVINKKKTRVLYGNQCQSVTGIVINSDLGVRKKWVKNVRAMIHNMNRDYSEEKTILPSKINELKGCIAHLKHVNESRYKKIICEGNNCLNQLKNID